MPFRSARTVIRNATSNYRMTLTFSHLCGGEWTPGGWAPPAEIRPGQTGGMQSESDGILTGTEGYAKYDVTFGVRRLGMVYVYWTNPTAGVTRPRFAVHRVDVLPHCDYDNPDGDSVFYAMDQSVDFHLAPVRFFHTDSGGDIVRPADLAAAFTAGPVGGILWVAGLTNIYADAGWEYELRQGAYGSTSSALTPHGTTTTTVPVTQPPPPPRGVVLPVLLRRPQGHRHRAGHRRRQRVAARLTHRRHPERGPRPRPGPHRGAARPVEGPLPRRALTRRPTSATPRAGARAR
jgi:hypothetical protein